MTLNLNIDKLAGPGRRAALLEFDVVRDLDEPDFQLLAVTDRGMAPPALQKLTDRHHALARLLAAGMPEGEAAMTLSYDISRVSILKQSPAFQELLALYRLEVDREFAGILEHMAGLSKDALIELRDRLEDAPQKFSNRELVQVVTEMADRAGMDEGSSKLPTVIELIAQPIKSLDE